MKHSSSRFSLRETALGIVIAVASLALFFLVLEGTLRAYHAITLAWHVRSLPPVNQRALVPSSDPALIFELNPGWSNADSSINAQGMLDREIELEKPEGVFRIAFFGDSITGNLEIREIDEIYLKVMERKLNRLARDGEVFQSLNFGVNAYSIQQTLRMAWTRIPAFDPDLIVVQLCLNDPYPSDTPYGRPTPLHPLRIRNFLFRITRPARFWGYMIVDRKYDSDGWEHVEQGFEELAKLAADGRPMLTVLFPYLYRPAYEKWGYGEIHARYRKIADDHDVPLLDLLDAFTEEGVIDNRWPKDPIHPDVRGHEIAADAILRELKSRNLLDAGTTADSTR